MRLGLPFIAANGIGQNRTFIAGVVGTVLTNPAVPIYIDGNGQLGTLVPGPIQGSVDAPVGTAPPAPNAAARIASLEDVVRKQAAAIAELQALVRDLRRARRR
jgi:hypothetical protein